MIKESKKSNQWYVNDRSICYAFTTRKKKCYKKYEVKCEVLAKSEEAKMKEKKKEEAAGTRKERRHERRK